MDYSNICQGWIYCITNKVNGKKYIGQTIDYDTRIKRHLKYTSDENSVLHRAIMKHGSDNFSADIVVTFKAVNSEVRRKLLDFLEIHYIKKFQTLTNQNGYNLTLGGGAFNGFHHSEESRKKMSKSQKNSEICVENFNKNRYDARRTILLYNLNGSFYKEYPSITDFLKEIGKKTDPIHEHVFKALNDPTRSAYGYLWRYKMTEKIPMAVKPWIDPQWKTVYYYTKEGQLIAKYNCARDAAKASNVKLRTVKSSLERPATKKRRRVSNYWSYIPPVVNDDVVC